VCKRHGAGVVGFRRGCFSRFCGAGPLLARGVFFGEALLTGLALPVVVAHTAAVVDQSTTKLPEHGARGDYGDLARAVRVRQDLLVDQVVLLRLRRNDLEERAVLVEEQVRVAVAEDARTLGGEHEQLVAAMGHEEGAAAVLAAVQRVAGLGDLALAGVVDFARNVLVALGVQLVGGVVTHRGQGLDHGGLRRGRFGGWGGARRRALG